MTEQSSDSLTDSLNDQCQITEINGESKLLFYANSDFNATGSDQVSECSDLIYHFPLLCSYHYVMEIT